LVGQAISVLLVWRFACELGRPPLRVKSRASSLSLPSRDTPLNSTSFWKTCSKQDYPNYRSATLSRQNRDPAVAAIERQCAADPARATSCHAGLSVNEGRKLQTCVALGTVASTTKFWFWLTQISPERDWLRRLVEPIN
jgi:hypothetical protein